MDGPTNAMFPSIVRLTLMNLKNRMRNHLIQMCVLFLVRTPEHYRTLVVLILPIDVGIATKGITHFDFVLRLVLVYSVSDVAVKTLPPGRVTSVRETRNRIL